MNETPYYESDRAIAEYLLLHYGSLEETMPYTFGPHDAYGYPTRCVTEGFRDVEWSAEGRALDIGCAVGRSSFELARHCREVIGIDYSQRFIETAETMKRDGVMTYDRLDEGERMTRLTASVPEGIERERVHFEVGDATDLRDHLGAFDAVLLANLLCRLPRPMGLLERLPGLVNPGGHVFITTPLTWMEDYTPRENWLGGRAEDSVTTLEHLRGILEKDFVFVRRADMPFVIREHARKYQYTVAEASLWRRR